MAYKVSLKASHPNSSYRRDGQEFNKQTPVEIEELSEAIKLDPWLVIEDESGEKVTFLEDTSDATEITTMEESLANAANAGVASGEQENEDAARTQGGERVDPVQTHSPNPSDMV